MSLPLHNCNGGNPEAAIAAFYGDALTRLIRAEVPVLVGGGYAMEYYTEIPRRTKDIDIFVRERDVAAVRETFEAGGYKTEVAYPEWLVKAFFADQFIDIIFNAANGICPVDDEWFEYARPTRMFGVPVMLCPPEEMLWQKCFLLARDRCDICDVAHMVHVWGERLHWERLMRRFRDCPHVLLAQVVLFDFIYPDAREVIPHWIRGSLIDQFEQSSRGAWNGPRVCRGPLLSMHDFNVDLEKWGYADARNSH